MKLLEDRIIKDGKVFPGQILKVDSFLNHQIDMKLIKEMANEFYSLFKDEGITKILTIEASGIAIASLVAEVFEVPLLFAKKSKSKNIANDVYTAQVYSYTHDKYYDIIVSKDFLSKEDKVLIIDDFLALGNALKGLIELVQMSGAELAGCGIAIEKAFQPGGDKIRSQGIRVESLARVKSMSDISLEFCN